jgi:hypothetical protein
VWICRWRSSTSPPPRRAAHGAKAAYKRGCLRCFYTSCHFRRASPTAILLPVLAPSSRMRIWQLQARAPPPAEEQGGEGRGRKRRQSVGLVTEEVVGGDGGGGPVLDNCDIAFVSFRARTWSTCSPSLSTHFCWSTPAPTAPICLRRI